jgi:DeoR family transcriptional regulator, copper-sensing transcriptional repressor
MHFCNPQIIAFRSKEQAEQFQLGFGGDIYDFEEINSALNDEMSGKICHDSNKREL